MDGDEGEAGGSHLYVGYCPEAELGVRVISDFVGLAEVSDFAIDDRLIMFAPRALETGDEIQEMSVNVKRNSLGGK